MLMAGFATWTALAAAAPAHPQYRGTIVVSVQGDQTRIGGYTRLVEAYKKVQPGVDIKLELKSGAFGSAGGYDTWLNTQLASGAPRPDLVSGNYSITYDGYVDFDYYRRCVNPYTGRPWDQDLDFDFSILRNSMGQRIMLPTQAVHIQWFYNVDYFEANGLEVPKTWDAFMALCGKVRALGKLPITLRFDFRFHQWLQEILWDQLTRPNFLLARALPGDWCFNTELDRDWVYNPSDPFNDALATPNQIRFYKAIRDRAITANGPEGRELLKQLKAIAMHAPSDFLVAGASGSDAYAQFLRQEAVIHFDGTWLFPQIQRDMEDTTQPGSSGRKPFRWGTFTTPPLTGPLVKAPIRNIESSAGEYVSIVYKNQPQTDMVMDFVMFWLSPMGYQPYVNGQVEVNEFVPTGTIMIRGVTIPEKFSRLFADVKSLGNVELPHNQILMVAPPGSRLSQDAKQAIVDYIQDKISVEEAAKRLQVTMEEGVVESLRRRNLPLSILDHPEADPGG